MFHFKMFNRPNLGILILRIAVGLIFIYSGYMKLSDMSMTVQFFGMIGFGAFWAWVVSLTELVAGIAMVIGFGTQIAGLLLFITMTVATIKMFGQAGFMGSLGPIMLGISSLSIALSGCGKHSVCNMMHGKNCGTCKDGGKCVCQH